tara:strand:+ start:272 stop:499 length:228 start_codon:yes stop_codon:yes gene_type:complete
MTLYRIFIAIYSFTLTILFCSEYNAGDIVDLDDQDQRFTICNGDFFNNDLKLSYLNGDLNGGHYFVSWFDISATW